MQNENFVNQMKATFELVTVDIKCIINAPSLMLKYMI